MKFNKQSRQKMFGIWAKKEHRNLLRLYRAGVPCPEPIKQREHTLVLSFIGKDHWPAPQLREIDLSKANWRRWVLGSAPGTPSRGTTSLSFCPVAQLRRCSWLALSAFLEREEAAFFPPGPSQSVPLSLPPSPRLALP